MKCQKQWVYSGDRVYWEAFKPMLDETHILVAGQTGSGKSTWVHDFLWTLTALKDPNEAKFILLDPKRVELKAWAHTPFCMSYSYDIDAIIEDLDGVIDLMYHRYDIMTGRKSTEYDVWVVCDELGDLMLSYRQEVLPRLQSIAQLGRAANIHLLCATQCPNRKVIPAELTLNFTCKVALHCDTAIESRQIVGIVGAENLPRHGVALVKSCEGYYQVIVPMTEEYLIKDRVAAWQRAYVEGSRRLRRRRC